MSDSLPSNELAALRAYHAEIVECDGAESEAMRLTRWAIEQIESLQQRAAELEHDIDRCVANHAADLTSERAPPPADFVQMLIRQMRGRAAASDAGGRVEVLLSDLRSMLARASEPSPRRVRETMECNDPMNARDIYQVRPGGKKSLPLCDCDNDTGCKEYRQDKFRCANEEAERASPEKPACDCDGPQRVGSDWHAFYCATQKRASPETSPTLEPIHVAGPGTPIIGHRKVETTERQCPKCNRVVTVGCNYCACPYPQPRASSSEEQSSMNFYERNKITRPVPNAPSRSELLDGRSREQYLRNTFHLMQDMRKWRGSSLWSWVGAVTGHGSGYSMQICVELGWDPEMMIGPKSKLPPRLSEGKTESAPR